MTANQINQILTAAADGMTAEEIAAIFAEEHREAACDAAQALEDDDSDYAAERRAEMRGMGKYDFNEFARNDAGEYLGFM